MEIILAAIVIMLVVAIIVMYSALAWGIVVYNLYYWFILPVFTTLPDITWYQAIGLAMFIGLFKTAKSSNEDKSDKDKRSDLISFIINPWITLAVGYLIYLFIN